MSLTNSILCKILSALESPTDAMQPDAWHSVSTEPFCGLVGADTEGQPVTPVLHFLNGTFQSTQYVDEMGAPIVGAVVLGDACLHCQCVDCTPVAERACYAYGWSVAGYMGSNSEADSISNYNDHNDTAPGAVDVTTIAEVVVDFRGEVIIDGTTYPWATSAAALAGGPTPSTTYEYAVLAAMNSVIPAGSGIQIVHGSSGISGQGNSGLGIESPAGVAVGWWSEQGYTDGAGGTVWSTVTNWMSNESGLGSDTYGNRFVGVDPGVFTNVGDASQGPFCGQIDGLSPDPLNPAVPTQ